MEIPSSITATLKKLVVVESALELSEIQFQEPESKRRTSSSLSTASSLETSQPLRSTGVPRREFNDPETTPSVLQVGSGRFPIRHAAKPLESPSRDEMFILLAALAANLMIGEGPGLASRGGLPATIYGRVSHL